MRAQGSQAATDAANLLTEIGGPDRGTDGDQDIAGFEAVIDHRGRTDREGRPLVATHQALGDELAAAAGMLMDKGGGFPVILVRGVETDPSPGTVRALIRDEENDLFRAERGARAE